MKKLFAKIFNAQVLIIIGTVVVAVALSFVIVNSIIIPGALKKYGLAPVVQPKVVKEKENKEVKKEIKGEGKEKPGVKKEIGFMYNLNPIIVNVAGSDARRFLKTQIVLELSKEKLAEEMEKRAPQIYNSLNDILSSYRVEDISDNTGKDRIRSEVMSRINLILTTGKVVNVYLTEFVIQ